MSKTFKNQVVLGILLAASACSGAGSEVGKTDFTTEDPGQTGRGRNGIPGAGEIASADSKNAGPPGAAPPNGRTAAVEEADIYRIDKNRLFYLNTYKGFVIYDVNDAQNPKRLGKLPVFGYPIEMFVDGNTVYALLRDALYLTQVSGKLQFERHNVSQMVAIDISDLANPRILQTTDIIGELREGVSRKVENSIYVVSYISQSYYWGWNYPGQAPQQKEQAWVYSFDVSAPKSPRLVQKLQLFEGGSVNIQDPKTGFSVNRSFGGVSISATSNALMVVENWDRAVYINGQENGCGSYESSQQAVVSIVDISDPKGSIKVHTRFETAGQLLDQFKQTYVYDDAAKTGTYYGIFARQTWASAGCNGESQIRNTIESWDVTDGGTPSRLSRLDFGKPNETVRGSAFDTSRHVAYAITARQIDPLYAISLADRNKLKVVSAVDGLSGDMSVFRLLGDGRFLMGIGRDNSNTCSGFDTAGNGWQQSGVAVSIIDVRDLAKVRLVQRQCVAVQNAEWIGSAVNWDMDQAHKMIGMHSDDQANVITVPVYYYKKNDSSDWWWYQYETAVGMMTWDLSRYDDTKSEKSQSVLRNFGTFIHPNGEVKRSIVFTHEGATPERMMINLSDTHITVANIQDLAHPKLESTIEVAPYYNQIFSFGDYIVEQVLTSPYSYGPAQNLSEFRVKKAGGDIEDKAALATFRVGQVQQVVKYKDSLVLFRQVGGGAETSGGAVAKAVPVDNGQVLSVEALIYDLSNPEKPRQAGKAKIPTSVVPYYRYWCGADAYWGGYWFGYDNNWTSIDGGLVFLNQTYQPTPDFTSGSWKTSFVFLDLRDTALPKAKTIDVGVQTDWSRVALVADPVDPKGFYLSFRNKISEVMTSSGVFSRYKDFAQRWDVSGNSLAQQAPINLPGPLVRTFANSGGVRMFLTQDYTYRPVTQDGNSYFASSMRVRLARQISAGGKIAAELRDSHDFKDMYLSALLLDGQTLFINGRKGYGYYGVGVAGGGVAKGGDVAVASPGGASASAATVEPGWEETSDRLMIFDLSQDTLATAYDQPMKAYNVELMGTRQGQLFINLQGDGVLVVDVSNPAAPVGTHFVRTLGYGTNLEFAGNDAYLASGYFGIYHLGLTDLSGIAVE